MTLLAEPTPSHRLKVHFHPGQQEAWNSTARIILALAGRQSGKTSFIPYWLFREIQTCGPGDYMVVSPDYQLLGKKCLPEILGLFQTRYRLGRITGRTQHFEFSPYGCKAMWQRVPEFATKIFFGHAQDPESLESATAKAICCDEAGQRKFKLESYEALRGRLSINRARMLIATTPYTVNWLKTEVYDKCTIVKRTLYHTEQGDQIVESRRSPDGQVETIHFESTMNPVFDRAEFEEHRRSLPAWKFDLFYRARFTRPAGAIYDGFDALCQIPAFPLPDGWPRYLGLDFGGVHTAGVFLAAEMAEGKLTDRWFLYREYPERGQWKSGTAKEHVQKLLKGEVKMPIAFGGAASEDQWREEFRAAGLPVREPPIKEVEAGIDRVRAAFRDRKLFIFDNCAGVINDLNTYSYELDEKGDPTEKIEDKETFHYADAVRYILAQLNGKKKEFWMR